MEGDQPRWDIYEHDPLPERPSEEAERQRMTDDELIAQGIAQLKERLAEGEWATLDDTTARIIASQFHDGQGSGLYSFQSTGAIDHARAGEEALRTWEESDDATDREKLDFLVQYFLRHNARGPVMGWHEATRW